MKVEVIKCDGCGTTKDVLPYKMEVLFEGKTPGYSNRDWCWTCFKGYVLSSRKPLELLRSIHRR